VAEALERASDLGTIAARQQVDGFERLRLGHPSRA
jgi:hypothetical protein